jgi:hypothetical protein
MLRLALYCRPCQQQVGLLYLTELTLESSTDLEQCCFPEFVRGTAVMQNSMSWLLLVDISIAGV